MVQEGFFPNPLKTLLTGKQFLGIPPEHLIFLLLVEEGKMQFDDIHTLKVSTGPVKKGHIRTPKQPVGADFLVDSFDQLGM
jgi:hypothetical protein